MIRNVKMVRDRRVVKAGVMKVVGAVACLVMWSTGWCVAGEVYSGEVEIKGSQVDLTGATFAEGCVLKVASPNSVVLAAEQEVRVMCSGGAYVYIAVRENLAKGVCTSIFVEGDGCARFRYGSSSKLGSIGADGRVSYPAPELTWLGEGQIVGDWYGSEAWTSSLGRVTWQTGFTNAVRFAADSAVRAGALVTPARVIWPEGGTLVVSSPHNVCLDTWSLAEGQTLYLSDFQGISAGLSGPDSACIAISAFRATDVFTNLLTSASASAFAGKLTFFKGGYRFTRDLPNPIEVREEASLELDAYAWSGAVTLQCGHLSLGSSRGVAVTGTGTFSLALTAAETVRGTATPFLSSAALTLTSLRDVHELDLTAAATYCDGTVTFPVGTLDGSERVAFASGSGHVRLPISYLRTYVDPTYQPGTSDDAVICAALLATRSSGPTSNDRSIMECFVLGLDPTDPTSVPRIVWSDTPTGVALSLAGVTPSSDSGVTINYRLERADNLQFANSAFTSFQLEDTFDIALGEEKVQFYRMHIEW